MGGMAMDPINMRRYAVLFTLLLYGFLAPTEALSSDAPEGIAKRLIVKVRCENSAGAGIIIGKIRDDVYIVTADHILGMAPECKVEFKFYEWVEIPTKILRRFPKPMDKAVLRATLPDDFPQDKIPISNVSCGKIEEGQILHIIGHPGGDSWVSPNQEIKLQDEKYFGTLKFNYPCLPGYSGGGVFSEDWHLLGMILDQDGNNCIARNMESIMVEIPEHIFQLNCSNMGLNAIIQKLMSSSSNVVVGTLTQLTGPFAPNSEIKRIESYFKYQNATNASGGKTINHFVYDVAGRYDVIQMNIAKLKAKNCQLIIVDSSIAKQETVEKMIRKQGIEAFLVKRGEPFDP